MPLLLRFPFIFLLAALPVVASAALPVALRCEYLERPTVVDTRAPRLSWQLSDHARGAAQTGWQIQAATSHELLNRDAPDLWDSGRVPGRETNQIAYAGRDLASGQRCFWRVRSWDERGEASPWSETAEWEMGLLHPSDWTAQWISRADLGDIPTDRETLHLPPPTHFRKDFTTHKSIRRATVYASALGIYDLYCNGELVGDAYFQPGWADYKKRAHYRSHDVTDLVRQGRRHTLGAVVADGWYAGYVGYGLFVGYGPNRLGRMFYGENPALLAQLEIEYTDGSRETIGTDDTWQLTTEGPTREADFLMGETYDARRELTGWSAPGYDATTWSPAVLAAANPSETAVFHDAAGRRMIDLAFAPPPVLQGYAAPPIRLTQELPARAITEPLPGVYIFDLGQNFAGLARLKIRGSAGTRVQLRFGEMLNNDGTLMTENLRRARATDTYILRGDPAGETWSPRFTYHGFQYVEVTGLSARPALDAITGLVLHNDTPLTGDFACSDEVLTQFGRNAQWTQRANFFEVPTDCPQRDERLGWMGDAQAYVRTASFNADVAAFFTKWLDDVVEAQTSYGAYPDYAPYPMTHGEAGKPFGSGWTDAGIICPWTIWQVYGDTRLLERNWDSMTRFMEWRFASTTPEGLGTSLGNPWGDWLNVNETTPVQFIDTAYQALTCALMAEMAEALNRPLEAEKYRARRAKITSAFRAKYLEADGTLTVDTQTAYVLALWADLLPADRAPQAVAHLATKIAGNDHRMATGFLGTRSILPALSDHGENDLAIRLFQSRKFPSWGYAVTNGANTVWERWDSYTKEHGFNGENGTQNAAMNSFSHYAFGAVMEWAYRNLAGINTDGPGYRHIIIKPAPPEADLTAEVKPIDWVDARYDSINGRIRSRWQKTDATFTHEVTIPANTTASIYLPDTPIERVTESGLPLSKAPGVKLITRSGDDLKVDVAAGTYVFTVAPPGHSPGS